jgi:hypothetical protein
MRFHLSLAVMTILVAGCGGDSGTSPSGTLPRSTVSFFVSSAKSTTGNLGGLRGADSICQNLASAVGLGSKTWRAYLSVQQDPDNGNRPTDARSRIGSGPWFNANGVLVARDVNELHSLSGEYTLFVVERGTRIAGEWPDSPRPIEHDILTGSNPDGTLMAGFTCNDWTSSAAGMQSQVGHSDGRGPNATTAPPFNSWNSAHTGQCSNTAPGGGAGRIYCFAR